MSWQNFISLLKVSRSFVHPDLLSTCHLFPKHRKQEQSQVSQILPVQADSIPGMNQLSLLLKLTGLSGILLHLNLPLYLGYLSSHLSPRVPDAGDHAALDAPCWHLVQVIHFDFCSWIGSWEFEIIRHVLQGDNSIPNYF